MAKAARGPIPVVVMGLGFVGRDVARAALASPEVRLVGAVDIDPKLEGRKLGEWIGDASTQVRVSSSLKDALGRHEGAVVLQATGSRLAEVADQILEAVRSGCHVVSSCEELAFPWLKHPELAEKLERAAGRAGVSILGTGVNPGFVLDRLLATAGQVCGPVRHARAERTVDARQRREALQRKIGAGLTEAEFEKLAEEERVGHVGLIESAALAALGLGLECDDFEEEMVPVIAEEDIPGGAIFVPAGRVAGFSQTAVALDDGQERVRLDLIIAMGAEPVGDRLVIDADPRVELEIRGGVAGDKATANLLVNAAPRVAASEPGLLTVLELPAGR